MEIKEQLHQSIQEINTAFKTIVTINELNDLKAKYLGKKGVFSQWMLEMKNLPVEEKPQFGQAINIAKAEIMSLFEDFYSQIEQREINEQLAKEVVDISLPGRKFPVGAKHLVSQVIEEVEDLFIGMGYTIKEGPEIEQDLYNFEMLNLPKSHPARDMQDSFYITEELLLRTHTSPVQIRTLLENGGNKPIKIICPGKVYRRDDDDQTHSHQFTQIEALVVDHESTLADLKGTLLLLAKKMFGEDRQIRLRPSYFPFTEPSVEVDISCYKCNGKGCSMCKGSGWIEILGGGMVNNAILEATGYDSKHYQGFAFGVGVERLAILRYGIDDIRAFYINDLRFNQQFK
ncbi:MAG: phenylalanine--tRNA ligase subunit alpha [Candidatus Izemoplasmatales bacterium]|jgi:phenylalanyl-tRNA synthetase alpha chain|nr:phenylalanine--tRNA ligase subunit alpha [Candidatus Izemoplasmatales bacterium]MDD3865845.1 phenylalanine--tRNA ligase subunit alpha [Candidatus Izemoplasmatales bacterium]